VINPEKFYKRKSQEKHFTLRRKVSDFPAVTLTGEVNSQSRRAQVEKVASTVPNVQQVVNELQVKDQKATSSH
jgi:hypothetical protein